MSSDTWTLEELLSSVQPEGGECWRIVEAQHKVSTAKLTDTLAEQELLEELIEETKPALPAACLKLDYLLAAPFRYAPYPNGSRFRRANQPEGVFYAAYEAETAVCEAAFYRLLFFTESPGLAWPSDAAELTAFSVSFSAAAVLVLTAPPINRYHDLWIDPVDYRACQEIADASRQNDLGAIKYQSVRDPEKRHNVALLSPVAFTCTAPLNRQTWRILLGDGGVRAICEFPRTVVAFDREAFAADPRIKALAWRR